MLWIFFVTYEFPREPFLRLFVFRFITERVRINIFLRKFQTIHYVLALRKLVGSKYRKQSSPSYINVLLRFSYTVLFELMKTVKLLLFLPICPDFSDSSQGRNWNFQWNQFIWLFAAFIIYDSSGVTHHTGNRFFTLSLLLIHVR